jgi:hypothetical protein
MTRSTRSLLAAALALVLITNAVVLLGVRYNRAGKPDATVTLTERELSLPPRYGMVKEDSGLSLRLDWRAARGHDPFDTLSQSYRSGPVFLDREKLAELGFDVKQDPDSPEGKRHYDKMLPKDALLVLEYDGAAYRRTLDLAEQHLRDEQTLLAANPGKEEFVKRAADARKFLEAEQGSRSRLFVVDAGTDYGTLRGRYSDRTRYMIAHGVVRPIVSRTMEGKNRLNGMITAIHMTDVNVPLALRGPLDPLIPAGTTYTVYDGPPRYSVTLRIGRRLEPWIAEVTALPKRPKGVDPKGSS